MPNWKKLIVSGSDANLNSLDITTELTASDALITNDLDVLGNITASGNISASGDLYTNNSLFVGNKGAIGTDGNDLTLIANTAEWTGIQIGRFSTNTQNIELYGPVTASGNVSASGDFIGTNFTGSSFTGSFVGDGSGLTDTPINITAGTALTFTGDTLNVSTAGANLGSSNVPSSAANRNYNIQHQNNAAQTLVVNVPWTDNNTEYTAGTGLSLSAGDEFSVNTAGGVLVFSPIPTTVSNRYYGIQTNISDELIVNVPWTDTSWDGIFSGSAQITGSLGVTGSVLVDGNVGIGTTSPEAKLDVESQILISGTDPILRMERGDGFNSDVLKVESSTDNLIIGDTSLDDIIFEVDNGEAMRILGGGNVGIGTTSPGQKLDVSGNIRTNSNLYVYNSDLSRQALRVNAEATTNTGIFKLSNGSNWGLLMRGEGNNPYIGSYFGGNLSITGFEDSTGTSPSAIKLAQFVFGGTGGGSGYLTLNGDLKVNNNKKIQFGYANSQENGIEWVAGSKISAAITPVDTANFSRTGLGFFTGDFSDGTTNADERMRITRAGNVGIGTTSPNANLDIENASGVTIDINSSSGDGQFRFQDNGTTKWSVGRDNTQQNFIFSNSAGLTSDNVLTLAHSTGNVGIGATSPIAKLQVQGTTSPQARIGYDADNYVQVSVNNVGDTTIAPTGGGAIAADLTLSAGSAYIKIDAQTNNVGIGTNDPDAKLHVKSSNSGATTQSGTLIVEAGSSPSIQLLSANTQTQTIKFGDPQDGDAGRISYSHSTNDMTLVTNGGDRVTIDDTGNVGIGTTSPARQLTLSGNSSPIISLASNTTGGEPSIYFGDTDDDNEGRIVYSNSQDAMQIWTAAAERIRVTSAGDTGVGVTAPRAKLDVAGGVKVADDTDTASANKVGTLRYRYVPGSPKNFSYVDMCMQTGASSYAWVNIVQNVWN